MYFYQKYHSREAIFSKILPCFLRINIGLPVKIIDCVYGFKIYSSTHVCLCYNWEYNIKHSISCMFFTQSCRVNFLQRTLGSLVQNFAKMGLPRAFLIKIAKLGLPTMVFLIKINLASLLSCF